jgi:hypothetical protein
MTTNLSLDQINMLLNRANEKDENIRITRSIGSIVEFLDVWVQNNSGQLKTSVFHKPAAEPYILPYSSDHPRHIHRSTINGALFRAGRLCSNVQEFDQERLTIELTLLLNGYPPRFVSFHFKRFFQQHNAISLLEQLDHTVYREIHRKLILQPTRREREQEDCVLHDENFSSTHHQQRQEWNKKEIQVHFTFESGPILELKHELHRLWKQYYNYPGSPMNNVTLKIGTRTNKSLNQLLVKKKPPRSMLVSEDSRITQ